mgnify:CR=1
ILSIYSRVNKIVKIHSIWEKIFPYALWYSETLSSITIKTLEVIANISKISKSRPEIGFVKYKTELINQDSKQVFFTESTLIIKSKS